MIWIKFAVHGTFSVKNNPQFRAQTSWGLHDVHDPWQCAGGRGLLVPALRYKKKTLSNLLVLFLYHPNLKETGSHSDLP